MKTYKILALGNYGKDAMYHPFDNVAKQLEEILKDMAELICTDNTEILKNLESEHFDAVISYLDIWDQVLAKEEADALETFVAEGGALLAIHNGISIQGSENLKKLVGGSFLTHPVEEEITFIPTKEWHPVTEGVKAFSMVEEPYQFSFEAVPYQLFLNYCYQGKTYPAGWCREVNRGRVIFLTPGHTAEKFENPEYRKLIQNSLRWCLRELA